MMIESKSEADRRLKDLLEKWGSISMTEIKIIAKTSIKDPGLKNYFIAKAREMKNGS